MKRFKKILVLLGAVVCTLCFSLGFSSCKGNDGTRGLEYDAGLFSKYATVEGMGESKATQITIASIYRNRPVTEIKEHAFKECSFLTSVKIPDSVTKIGRAAFYKCSSLQSIEIPDGVTAIESSLFESCTSLESVKISSGATTIGAYAFCRCTSLKSITIPNGVKRIQLGAFLDCSTLESITIPDKLIEISGKAFQNTAYFNNEENWENGLLYIGNHLIEAQKDELVEATVKEGTKTIAGEAFKECATLENVTVLDGVIMIGESAFEDCASLISITIPKSVRVVGNQAFYNCGSLTTIYYQGTKENWYEVSKGEGWNYRTGEYTVICTDGQI